MILPCTFHSGREAVYVDSVDGEPLCPACASHVPVDYPNATFTVIATGETVRRPLLPTEEASRGRT
jgi:hypothetical protein